ncbi:MAG: DUF1326 domain-containing protein [Chloroflexota bacterium]
MAQAIVTKWTMKGKVLIACNCDWGCPCNVNAPPTQGNCEGGWTWEVEEGAFGETKLDGLYLSLYCDWPGAIHEGNGVATALFDERADAHQREALSALVEGSAGGPWGVFRKTFTTLHGPTAVRYEASFTGELPQVTAGDILDCSTQFIRNPVTSMTSHPRIVLPEGMILKDAALLASKRFVVRDGVKYDHSGQYAAFGFFAYTGP